MQNLHASGGADSLGLGDRVIVRQQRWRVASVEAHRDCAIVTLAGSEPANAGTRQRILTPFEPVQRLVAPARLRLVSRHRWRRACRALLAESSGPESLRSAAGARIDLLAHQLEPALAIVKGLGTRVLLADAVGLGKTIETGLILAELLARGAATRILVLTPAGLREQWIEELSEKFDQSFVLADASAIRGIARRLAPGLNPWAAAPLAVASYDFVKRPEVEAAVRKCHWDAVVVDEAHNIVPPSDRHAAVSRLCETAAYVVLLTATPHSGDEHGFASLLQIGGSGAPPLIFRRTRADVGLATERRVHQLVVRPSPAEKTLHARLLQFTQAVEHEHRDEQSALALAVLRKRALSSAHAIGQSVRRRLAAMDSSSEFPPWQPQLPLDAGEGEVDQSDDMPAWTVPVLSDARQERRLLLQVAAAADRASFGESKLRVLGRLLQRLNEPAIVFTEYRDTLMHVRARVVPDAPVLHGGMNRVERRAALAAIEQGAVLLATDAAGEGLNLQRHCRVVINLELPWSPVRLEQRIGRVDRIGQNRRVHAFHLIAGGTAELEIRHRLSERLARARCAIGANDALGGTAGREAPATARAPVVPLLRLVADAALERQRVQWARLLTGRGSERTPGDQLIGRSGRRARRALGGRALVIVQTALQSKVGETIATFVASATVPRAAVEQELEAFVQRLRAPAHGAWATTARAAHRLFWDARLAREAVLETVLASGRSGAQPALFDRRMERDRERSENARQESREALDERLQRLRQLAIADDRLQITILVLVP